MFDKKSRYAKQDSYLIKDGRGRWVNVIEATQKPVQTLRGYHVRKQGQRLDHMAHKYLQDDTGYWRIAEFNNVMQAEVLSEMDEIGIPNEKN